MTTSHVTIIGAGIIGVSTAAFLQRAGHAVTIIDRLAPGEGCSFGNAGGVAFAEIMPTIHQNTLLKIPGWLLDPLGPLTIRWSHLPKAMPWFLAAARNALPEQVREITAARAALGLRAVADFETLLRDAEAMDLMVRRETLRVFDNNSQFERETSEREIKAAHGFPCETFSGDQAREMEPALSPHITHAAYHGGWYFITNPGRLVKSIATALAAAGGSFIADDVRQIEASENRATSLQLASGRRLPIDKLVICAGAYSHLLCRQIGDQVLLESERGYHMVLPSSGINLSRSISYARTPGVATPMEMGLRLAGTDEFAGLDAPPNYARADALWRIFKLILPALREPDGQTTRWMGHRPGTPDSLPIIGPSPRVTNVFYGFGHGHMGLTWAPTTGRLISELVTGIIGNMDLAPYGIVRFARRK
jgi:D-amino-acid dehydrogenase